MDEKTLKNILEAGLLVAGRTLSLAQLEALFQHDQEKPERKHIREALESLKADYEGRGIELVEVASGFRLQSHESVSDWVANLFQEKTPRYSRALLETLVLIAYRQPITRAEIEDVRGVAVSTNIIKTLQERQWVKVLGHKEVPGKPALLGTTKEFLDYFNLKKLDELPELADIKDLDQFDEMLAEEEGVGEVGEQGDAANDDAGNDDQNHATQAANGTDDADEHAQPIGAGPLVAVDEMLDLGSSVESLADSSSNDSSEADAVRDGDEASVAIGESDGGKASVAIDGSDGDEASVATDGSDGDEVSAAIDGSDSDEANNAIERDASDGPEAAVNQSELDAADGDSSEHDTSETGSVESDSADGESENSELNETLSGPELDLLRVISDFSEEHQQELDARDQMEAGILSNKNAAAEDIEDDEIDEADLADLSQRVADETHNGDMPEPGDTLH